ncbi:MAG: aspartate kinase [Flavobacteriales bacterium]|nr:aspartate kinase [Flavobacteriales bacterium]MCB9449176.1 aspartate kinase [Flavobacteriales bacterium]
MKVFKFGGASVKDAASVKNVASVLRLFPKDQLVVVVSAMGKTTNALEVLVKACMEGKPRKITQCMQELKTYHATIINGLFDKPQDALTDLETQLGNMERFMKGNRSGQYDFVYDQLVSMGEVISTRIIAAYLNSIGFNCTWLDAREVIRTDGTFREGKVDWKTSSAQVKKAIHAVMDKKKGGRIVLTQGFIGSTPRKQTTTLGREGSDYTAAIFAHILDAEEVAIWKDVPGVLNADPKWFDDTVLLPQLSYRDAIELSYYGATVIHPKTIKPLENKKIPLKVKSFVHPREKGTVIGHAGYKKLIPSFIFRINQALLSIQPKDFSFIAEENLSLIFGLFSRHRIKINVMQNSAISFLVSVDHDDAKVKALVKDLSKHFNVDAVTGKLELITIRYYDQKTIDRVCVKKEVLLEQKSATTVQLVVRDIG